MDTTHRLTLLPQTSTSMRGIAENHLKVDLPEGQGEKHGQWST